MQTFQLSRSVSRPAIQTQVSQCILFFFAASVCVSECFMKCHLIFSIFFDFNN